MKQKRIFAVLTALAAAVSCTVSVLPDRAFSEARAAGVYASANSAAQLTGFRLLNDSNGLNNFVGLGSTEFGTAQLPAGRRHYQSTATESDTDGTAISATSYSLSHSLENTPFFSGNAMFVGNTANNSHFTAEFHAPGEGFTVYGDLSFGDEARFKPYLSLEDSQRMHTLADVPYLYVDGALSPGDHFSAGDLNSGQPVNIYAGSLVKSAYNSEFQMAGDLYLYDPEAASEISKSGYDMIFRQSSYEITRILPDGSTTAAPVGGSLYCANRSLLVGNDSRSVIIDGDLVFTNPEGVLTLTGNVTIRGWLICAGQLVIDCGSKRSVTVEGGVFADRIEVTSGTVNADIMTQIGELVMQTGDVYALFPFDARPENILEEYVFWDDPDLLPEDLLEIDRFAAGEMNYYAQRGIAADIRTTEFVRRSISDINSGSYAANDIVQTVLYPTLNTAADLGFVPVPPHTDEAYFSANFPTDLQQLVMADPDAAEIISPERQDVTVYGHDHNGNPITAAVSAQVVNRSGTVSVSSNTLFIDPTCGGYSADHPLVLVLDAPSTANDLTIIVNNTAHYASDYSSPFPNEEISQFPAGDEVIIFLQDGFRALQFYMVTSGLYVPWRDGQIDLIGRPAFPNEPDFAETPAQLRYAYEYVPNAMLCGQRGSEYSLEYGLINADIRMPLSKFDMRSPHSTFSSMTYRINIADTEISQTGTSYSSQRYYPHIVGSALLADFGCRNGIAFADVAYRAAQTGADAELIASGDCGAEGADLRWQLDNTGTLTVYGRGEMADFTVDSAPWQNYLNEIRHIEIAAGVTSIGDYAFRETGSLQTVSIPDTVSCIGASAFMASGLESAILPESVSDIGSLAFAKCESLSEIMIQNPECVIADSESTVSASAVIYGHTGSTAEQYAQTYARDFVAMEEPETTEPAVTTEPFTTATVPATTLEQTTSATEMFTTVTELETTTVVSAETTTTTAVTAADSGTTTTTTAEHDSVHTEVLIQPDFTPPPLRDSYESTDTEYIDLSDMYVTLWVIVNNVNGRGELLDADGNAVLVRGNPVLYADADTLTLFNACVKEFSAPVTEYVHADYQLDSPAEIWAAAQTPQSGASYKVVVYYDPAEADNPIEYLDSDELLEVGSFEIVITGDAPAYDPRGDLNGDGEVGLDDAQRTLAAYVLIMSDSPNPLSESETLAADVDQDGAVTLTDAQLILLYYTNRLTDNPVTWNDLLGKNTA